MKIPHTDHSGTDLTLAYIVRGKYFWLLLMLMTMIFIAPHFQDYQLAGVRIVDIFNGLLLLAAVYAVAGQRWHLYAALLMLAPAAATNLIIRAFQTPPYPLVMAEHILLAMFLVYLTFVIMVDILSGRRVTADQLKGAVCAYLLIGLTWAVLFSLCAYLDPDAFAISPALHITVDDLVFHNGRFGATVYFSMVTLTSLGYGDIVPNSAGTRPLAVMEAVFGQVYLTILVARLVGIHITPTPESPPTQGESRSE